MRCLCSGCLSRCRCRQLCCRTDRITHAIQRIRSLAIGFHVYKTSRLVGAPVWCSNGKLSDVVACSRCSRLQSIVFGELIQISFCRNHRSTKRGGPGASGLHVSSLMIMLRRRQSLCFCDIASRRCHITLSISAPYPTCHHRH